MTILFILLTLFVGGLAFLIILGFFLPKAWRIERAVLVEASVEDLYELLQNWREWERWSVWNAEQDPRFEAIYEGPEDGLPVSQIWQGRLPAALTWREQQPCDMLVYEQVIAQGALRLRGTLALGKTDAHLSQVAWRLELLPVGGNPVRRYQAYFLQSYFETAMDASLQQLQALFAGTQFDRDHEEEDNEGSFAD